jgi:hypothetical protein
MRMLIVYFDPTMWTTQPVSLIWLHLMSPKARLTDQVAALWPLRGQQQLRAGVLLLIGA